MKLTELTSYSLKETPRISMLWIVRRAYLKIARKAPKTTAGSALTDTSDRRN